ncbi:MAG TPA: hypothetical protein VKN63_10865 [Afifellaceae bacterium]|nr:hypothetical protein [Afifellaceae bacterium]
MAASETLTGRTLKPIFVPLDAGDYTLAIDIGNYIPLYESACATPTSASSPSRRAAS